MLFCRLSGGPCWSYLTDIFSLMSVCPKCHSFTHSFIQSADITLRAYWGRIDVPSHPPPTPLPPSFPCHPHWSLSCQLSHVWVPPGHFGVNISNTKLLTSLSWPNSLLGFLTSRNGASIHYWLRLKPRKNSWPFSHFMPHSNPAPSGLSINIDQMNWQVVKWEGEWMNNALSGLHLTFQPAPFQPL